MPASADKTTLSVLILGGTAEANELATKLRAASPAARVTLSLAGRTKTPRLPDGVETRIGGFGGADGLAAYMRETGIDRLVDATHPFAAGMSRNAEKAAALGDVRRIALVRPAWAATEGDRWRSVECLGAARDALPQGARPFLALGRQHLAPFAHRSDLSPIVRMIDPPEPPLPFAATLVLGKPLEDEDAEATLLTRHGATHLVCRNSGGAGYAKVAAARRLFLPVIMIERPKPPAAPLAGSPNEVLAWLGVPP